MKRINIQHLLLKGFLLLVTGFISEVSYAQDKMLMFDLKTFVLAVKENNLQLKIANNNSSMAALSIKEAIAALLPQINGQAGAKRNFNKQYIFFESPDFVYCFN